MLSRSRAVVRAGVRGLSCSPAFKQRALEGEADHLEEPLRPAAVQAATMMDVGTRSIFTGEHDMFRESVRRFMKEKLEPLQVPFEEAGQPSKEIWLEMGAQVNFRSFLEKWSFLKYSWLTRVCNLGPLGSLDTSGGGWHWSNIPRGSNR